MELGNTYIYVFDGFLYRLQVLVLLKEEENGKEKENTLLDGYT